MNESIKRIIKELLIVIILRYSSMILPINFNDLLNDNYILTLLVSLLITYEIYIKNNESIDEIRKKYLLVVGVIGLIVNFLFAIFSIILIIFFKSKKEKNEEIIKKNIDDYFKNKDRTI